MNERWRIVIELTFDPKDGDKAFNNEYAGWGAELDRAKERLNKFLDAEPFKHYHILKLPHKCVEFD
jgi:hypothetical protein